MTIKLDFSNVTGGDFGPITEGDYTLEIEKVEDKVSSAGNNMLNITFNILDEGDFKDRKVWDMYVMTEKALWKLQDLFVALGIDTDGLVEFNPQDLVGEIFIGEIYTQESQGYDPQSRIKTHKPAENIVL